MATTASAGAARLLLENLEGTGPTGPKHPNRFAQLNACPSATTSTQCEGRIPPHPSGSPWKALLTGVLTLAPFHPFSGRKTPRTGNVKTNPTSPGSHLTSKHSVVSKALSCTESQQHCQVGTVIPTSAEARGAKGLPSQRSTSLDSTSMLFPPLRGVGLRETVGMLRGSQPVGKDGGIGMGHQGRGSPVGATFA